jgi:uncharacterized coiled-coil protein SlyX
LVSTASDTVFGESITEKYYTQPYWIYKIEIEYIGDKQFYVFWDGLRINDIIPDKRLDTSEIEVYATTNETILQIFDSGDVDNLSADVRILDVIEIRPMTTEEIKKAKSLGIEDQKDKRIAELEDRVLILENENLNLEKEVARLNGIVNTLQDEIKKLTDEFFITIQNQFNWFQSKIER